MADGTIELELKLKGSGISDSAKKSGVKAGSQAGKGLEDGISKGSKSGTEKAKSHILSFGAIAGIASSIASKAFSAIGDAMGGAISRVDTMANFPKVMANLGYSSEDAAKSVQLMSDHLTGLPTRLDSLTQSVQRVAASTGGVGNATKIMMGFNDALLAGGAPAESQANAMDQLTKAIGKGKFEMDDWNTISAAMPGQLDQIARKMLGAGKNAHDLYDALKTGKVSMADFENAVVELDEKGGDGFVSFYDQAKDATKGIATTMANLQNAVVKSIAAIINAIGTDSLLAPLNALMSGIKDVGNGVADVITGIKPAVGDLGGAFLTLGESVPEDKLLNITGIMGGFGRDIQGAITGLVELVSNFVASGDAANLFSGIVSGISTIFVGAKTAAATLGDALGTFFSNIDTSGLSDLGAAAKDVGDAIGENLDNFADFASKVLSSDEAAGLASAAIKILGEMARAAGAAVKFLADNFEILSGVLAPVIGAIAGLVILEKIIQIFTMIMTVVGPIIAFLGELGAAFSLVFEAVAGGAPILGTIVAVLTTLFNPVQLVVVAIGALVAAFIYFYTTCQPFRDFITGIPAAITGAFSGIGEFFTNLFTVTIPEAFNSFVEFFAGIGETIVESVTNFFTVMIPEAFNSFVAFIGTLPEQIGYLIGMVLGVIASFVVNLIISAGQAGAGFVNAIIGFIVNLPANMLGLLTGLGAQIGSWKDSIIQWAIQAGSGFVSNLINFIIGLPGQVLSFLGNVISNVGTFVTNFGQKATDAAQSFATKIIDGLKSLPGKLTTAGGNLVKGIWDGIKNMGKWLTDKISGFADGIVKGFTDFFHINSPSKLMRDKVGRSIGEGIWVGVEVEDPMKTIRKYLDVGVSKLDLNYQSSSQVDALRNFQPVKVDAGGQTINFNQPITSPDEIARTMRMQQRYGLAGQY